MKRFNLKKILFFVFLYFIFNFNFTLLFSLSNRGILFNIAINKPVYSSSEYKYGPIINCNDGRIFTHWQSGNDNTDDWLYIDLLEQKNIERINICWGSSYAKSYKISISSDFNSWTDIYETNDGRGYTDSIKTIYKCRYVKLLMTEKHSDYSHNFIIDEVKIYSIVPDTVIFTIESQISDQTNHIIPTDSYLMIRSNENDNEELILKKHLTVGKNEIVINDIRENYEIILEKKGYFSHAKLYNRSELLAYYDTPLSIDLKEQNPEIFNYNSLHISRDLNITCPDIFKCNGNYAYIYYKSNKNLYIADISDIDNIKTLSNINNLDIEDLVALENELFILTNDMNKNIKYYNTTVKSNPVFIVSTASPNSYNGNIFIDKINNNLIATTSEEYHTTCFYNIKTNSNIIKIKEYNNIYIDAVNDNHAFEPLHEGYGTRGFQIYDITDPLNLTLVKKYDGESIPFYGSNSSNIEVKGNYLILESTISYQHYINSEDLVIQTNNDVFIWNIEDILNAGLLKKIPVKSATTLINKISTARSEDIRNFADKLQYEIVDDYLFIEKDVFKGDIKKIDIYSLKSLNIIKTYNLYANQIVNNEKKLFISYGKKLQVLKD